MAIERSARTVGRPCRDRARPVRSAGVSGALAAVAPGPMAFGIVATTLGGCASLVRPNHETGLAELRRGRCALGPEASGEISRSDHGIDSFGALVGDAVALEIHAGFRRRGGSPARRDGARILAC